MHASKAHFISECLVLKGCELGGYLKIMGNDKSDKSKGVSLTLSNEYLTYLEYHVNSNRD